MWQLQIKLQTQNSDAKRRWNAEVLQWHQETQEQARLAKYVHTRAAQMASSNSTRKMHLHGA